MAINLENYAPDYDWHDLVYAMAKDAARIMGIDIDRIYYSGFWSQGDGASFEGYYSYAKGAAKRIRAEYPSATELHAIADVLQEVQRCAFYRLTASVTQSGCYVHEMSMSVDVERSDGADGYNGEDSLTEALRDFARWIYSTLEKEYEYQSAWQIARAWQDTDTESMPALRADARSLVHDMRAARRAGGEAAPSICSALRSQLRALLDRWEEAWQARDDLADAFSYWQDGKSVSLEQFASANL